MSDGDICCTMKTKDDVSGDFRDDSFVASTQGKEDIKRNLQGVE